MRNDALSLAAARRCAYQRSPHAALRVDHASSNASATYRGEHLSLFVEAQV